MGSKEVFQKQKLIFKSLIVLLLCLPREVVSEMGDCIEQEYKDHAGNCIPCKQCEPGKELSKECGFGYGEDAQCVICRPNRFKEDWGFQKCKPCLVCALVNRFLKANCTATSNAVCGDCLPGFYRKTKLTTSSETLEHSNKLMLPCNGVIAQWIFKAKDPWILCVCVCVFVINLLAFGCLTTGPRVVQLCGVFVAGNTKVNLVKIPSAVSSPRDTALAAVICSALATVLLALLILCVIYCKRQFMEKKPSWSTRLQETQYNGAELSCFDRPRVNECAHRTCCQCQRNPAQTCGPIHLIPSLCCDETCSSEHSSESCPFHSQTALHESDTGSMGEMIPKFLDSFPHLSCEDISEAWPLMCNSSCSDDASLHESHHKSAEFLGVVPDHLKIASESSVVRDSDPHACQHDPLDSPQPHVGDVVEFVDASKESECMDIQEVPATGHEPHQKPESKADATPSNDNEAN
nr:PREDICTED: tumor necrosis factor receptor superfamily member 19 [Latimeria chalumnae]|eukprot:XP_014340791.1 PREDICTED: tumor necrosis factor receptor superfamily member 19 [Latimeria chalumnae]